MTSDKNTSISDPLAGSPSPLMANTLDTLEEAKRIISGAPRLAIDTESNSLHAYEAQVCLIQVSTDVQDILIDPLAFDDPAKFSFLENIFADPDVEKVFHAAEYDVMTLRRDFGYDFNNLFDTMIAARVLGWDRFGLGSILKDRFGVKVNKANQRANWGRRPLPTAMLRYAQMDTHYLLTLRDELSDTLAAAGRLEEARELFDEVCQAEWSGTGFDPEGYWRIHEARRLQPQQIAVLRELYLFREAEAEKRDVPVFKIMGDKTLMALAREAPQTREALDEVRSLSTLQKRRYSTDILDAVQRGLKAKPPRPPRRRNDSRPDEDVQLRYELLHTWRKERGLARGVASDVIVSKDALWEIAQKAPQTRDELADIDSLGPWRTKTYGDDILEVLATADNQNGASG